MTQDWKCHTEYHRCGCCGEALSGFVQETIPGRQRVYVTCENASCSLPPGRTLSPAEHLELCAEVRHAKIIL